MSNRWRPLSSQPLVSLVFSFRNESGNIPELVRRVTAVFDELDGYDLEMLFVNDRSTDESSELLGRLREKDCRIKILTMSKRFGTAPCVLAGLEHARGDAIVYMDSDLQDPPEVIPELISRWESGAEVVHTTRTKRHGESWSKMFLTRIAYRVINLFSRVEILENSGDFKLLSRRAVGEVLRLREYDPFMRGLVAWVGFRQDRIHYERQARFEGLTKFPLLGSLAPAKEFVRGITSFSSAPLYLALFLGISVSSGAFVYLSYIVFTRLVFGMHEPGWPAIMVTLLFLGGTILFTIGIQGIYIGKLYGEIKGRPRYIIDSTVGLGDDTEPRR